MIINSDDLYVARPIKDMSLRKIKGPLASHGLTEAGYDLRIKQHLQFTTRIMGGVREQVVHIHNEDGSIETKTGRFVLASAIEEFEMPTNLVGVVHDKSTWARHGLSVFNTVIEPGWCGFLTLELVYHGSDDLIIPAGTGIAQVLFHEISLERAYAGKYQNQEDKPVPSR